jgi:uncharacterized protein involved in response to NO
MALITIEEPAPATPKAQAADHPLWRLGFRPFYALAALFAVAAVPLWTARYLGWTGAVPAADLNWHMHEMVFGFAIAVIIGFLYTAGRNWTGLWTPRRGQLAALCGLWLAGRIAFLAGPPALAALVDLAFVPIATWPFYRVLQRTDNRRNMFAVALLALLTVLNALYHGAALGWIPAAPAAPIQAAILVIVVLESVIAGRIVPNFTAIAIPGLKPAVDARRDDIALALLLAAGLAWLLPAPAPLAAALAFAAGCAQVVRLAGWRIHRTLGHPLLWILHFSYAWIALGFWLLGLAELKLADPSAAFHALAVGSMAGLIVGMMTRTTLGHTGRPLQTGAVEVALLASTLAWSGAFLLFCVVYVPYLMRARVDGKEG